MKIKSHKFGKMVVGGHEYKKDLIILTDEVIPSWRRASGHNLIPEDILESIMKIVESKPDLAVIGTGYSNQMVVSFNLVMLLESFDMDVIAADTTQAVQVFNTKSENGEKVIGFFHITC